MRKILLYSFAESSKDSKKVLNSQSKRFKNKFWQVFHALSWRHTNNTSVVYGGIENIL